MKIISMRSTCTLPLIFLIASIVYIQAAPISWDDGGDGVSWSDPSNWNPNTVPGIADAVTIGTLPTGDPPTGLGVDVTNLKVSSFTVGSLLGILNVTPSISENIQINGAITSSSSFQTNFLLPVIAGASATWSGPLRFANNLNLFSDTNAPTTITLGGASVITFDTPNLNLQISGTATGTYSSFVIAGASTVFSGASINISLFGYTPVGGETWDFSNGNFSGATLGTLPTLGGGLTWDTTNFLTNGTLTVVPEPTTWALVAGSLTTVMIFRRRRS